MQESVYPSVNTNYYKVGSSEYGSNYSYYDYGHSYEVDGHGQAYHETRRPMVSPSMTNEQTTAVGSGWEGNANSGSRDRSAACKF